MDSRNADAYLGLAMSEFKCRDRSALQNTYIEQGAECRNNKHLARAKQFADEELRQWLEKVDIEATETKLRTEAETKRREKIAALIKEKQDCQSNLEFLSSYMPAFFSGRERRELKNRLAEVEAELKKLQ